MMKQSKLLYSGPASMQSNIPELPDSGPQSMSFMLLDALGNAAPSTMKVTLLIVNQKNKYGVLLLMMESQVVLNRLKVKIFMQ